MAEVPPTPWRPLVSAGVVDPDELSFGPGVPIIAEPLGGAVIWAAFAEIAQEWLSAPWDWPVWSPVVCRDAERYGALLALGVGPVTITRSGRVVLRG